ncbi:MAG: NmrA/HSCARG family protein [Holophagales bacterium]|nr:NmrA/HSCARG family protein [Holophagales bacterium]
MAEKRVIAVVGATGAQGGGLVRAILADPSGGFAARAITRNTRSDKAQALAGLGAEVVGADLDDADSLAAVFAGAYGAFCVTNFWEHFSPEKELAQAGALARAVREAGVSHVLWSTLEDTRRFVSLDDDRMPTLMGRYKVPHFDAKGEANALFAASGVPTTFFHTSFYWDNLIHFGMEPKRGADGKLAFVLPMADRKLPGIAAEDIGKCAYGAFQRGAELAGTTIGVAGDHLTGSEMAAALSRALGEEVAYAYVPPEVYRTFGFPGADDLANMFQFNRDFSDDFCTLRDLELSRSLNPAIQSFDAWLAANAGRIPKG